MDPLLLPHPALSGWMALTGSPGTGKSTASRWLSRHHPTVEVGDLAHQLRAGRRLARGGWEVDINLLHQRWRRIEGPRIVVGHLAHWLPPRDVILLRCHPITLFHRLALHRSPPLSLRMRRENAEVEAIDLLRWEAVRRRRRIWEVDTTHLSPSEVANRVETILHRHPPPQWGKTDWLTDPEVTDWLFSGRT